MKRMFAQAALLVLALAAPALAQDNPKSNPPPPSVEREASARNPHAQLGISGHVYIGDLAPDFELDSSHGVPVRLSRMRGDWVLMVFTDRRDQFVGVREISDAMRQIGVAIVGVCHEKARTLDTYAARDSVPLMLADVTGEISTMYGLFDSLHQKTVPGFLVLDREGIVRIAFSGQSLPPEEIGRLTQFAVTGF
jgi:peroxiredoxin